MKFCIDRIFWGLMKTYEGCNNTCKFVRPKIEYFQKIVQIRVTKKGGHIKKTLRYKIL